jgi:lysophospholipase L1-like esterase
MRRMVLTGIVVLIAPILLVVLLEVAVRVAYRVRTAFVEEIPLPFVVGQKYGPVPPWIDEIRLLESDPRLIWRNKPSIERRYVDIFSPIPAAADRLALLRRFWPRVPASMAANPVWTVSTNSDGFRDREFPPTKDKQTIRILCLGDSWTFGANVSPLETYPHVLEQRLRQRFPGQRLEVFNLGVLGYSSLQVEQLLTSGALAMAPDYVIVGVAMNDASVAGYHDKDLLGVVEERAESKPAWTWTSWLPRSELIRLARYLGEVRRFHAPSLGDYLLDVANPATTSPYLIPIASGMLDYERLRGQFRVALDDYAASLRRVVRAVTSAGASAILLYNELAPQSPYLGALQRLSQELEVPLVNSQALIARERERVERDLERQLGLQPNRDAHRDEDTQASLDGRLDIIFRTYVPERAVEDAIYITGPHSQLGNAAPNVVAMYDDGSHGDQRAGDRVWSYRASFAPGTRVFYVYTNSGPPNRWEGLDVPEIRGFVVPSATKGAVIYRPIDTFGGIYMQSDSWHTNGRGYALIADAIADVLAGRVVRDR